MNSGEYLRWVRRVEYLCLSEVLSIVSTIKFVDTILQDLAANLKMTLLDAYYFQEGYIAELQAMVDEGTHTPGPELALISQRDEVLDWREMQARYPKAKRILLPRGDHAISDFALHLDAVLEFLELV